MSNWTFPLGLLFVISICGGCAGVDSIVAKLPVRTSNVTSNPVPLASSIPYWVKGEPKVAGMICAVGVSEPTFVTADAVETATTNARSELARTLSVDIKSVMLDVSTSKYSSTEQANVMQVNASVSDLVMEQSKTIETWYDKFGESSLGKMMTYALVCMPRRK